MTAAWKDFREKERAIAPEEDEEEEKPVGKAAVVLHNMKKMKKSVKEFVVGKNGPGVGELDSAMYFQRMLTVIDKGDGDDLEEEDHFRYELCPYPPALFENANGVMRSHPDKMELTRAVDTHCGFNPSTCARPAGPQVLYIIDGRSLIRHLPWLPNEPYSSILERYLGFIDDKYGRNCVVVLDTRDKDEMKIKAGSKPVKGVHPVDHGEVSFNLDVHLSVSKEDFLSNMKNRSQFCDALASVLQNNGFRVLQSKHGDADYIVAKVALDSSSSESSSETLLISEEKDNMIVLLLSHRKGVHGPVYFAPDDLDAKPNTPLKTWNIPFLQERLGGDDVCRHLLFAYAFFGCETTSRIYGMGEGVSIKLLIRSEDFRSKAEVFLDPEATSWDIELAGEAAMIMVYGGDVGSEDGSLDAFRFKIFKAKSRGAHFIYPQVIPPTSAAVKYHSFRTYLQVQSWLGNSLNPEQWGWTRSDDKKSLVPIMTELPPAPGTMVKKIQCSCRMGLCEYKKLCNCRKYGMTCTNLCRHCLGGDKCENWPAHQKIK